MNWMLRFRRLLGRFWHDIFEDAEFLLGVEYLHSLYAKLIENQYLNWRNGMIAKDTSVEQDMQPVVVYLQADTTREWYPLEKIFAPTDEGRASAYSFVNNAMAAGDTNTGGWLTDSKDPVPDPIYMLDHVYGYTKMLVKGLDYDVQDSHFLFYVDPAVLWPEPEEGEKDTRPIVKMLDKDGVPHRYYKLFGYPRRESKVCDPVTGFESSWLNPFSDIVWDIHQNGATFYNMKQLLGKATDSVICEKREILMVHGQNKTGIVFLWMARFICLSILLMSLLVMWSKAMSYLVRCGCGRVRTVPPQTRYLGFVYRQTLANWSL